MGNYDEFFDVERNRVTQTKAFFNLFYEYHHTTNYSDKIYNENIPYRTYYVQALSPAYFIRIEGNRFTGIVSIIEDKVTSYPTFDYGGDRIKIDGDYERALEDLAEMSAILEENYMHLPMKKIRDSYSSIDTHVVKKISGKLWD